MTRLRALLLLIPLLVLGLSCSSPTASGTNAFRTVPVGEAFTLEPGETVQVAGTGTLLHFGGIDEDSRCPVDALILCVWEGNARARFWVGPRMGDALNFTLNTALEPRARDVGVHRVELRAVTPEARLEPPAPAAYRVELLVTRLP